MAACGNERLDTKTIVQFNRTYDRYRSAVMSDYHIAGQKISQERPSPWGRHLQRGTSCLEDVEQSVPDRFERVVALYPDRLAIKTAKHALTCDALNKAANRVSRVGLEKSGESDTAEVVVLEHDASSVVAIRAVLLMR